MNIQEIRQKYPQYNDMSDTELADSFHRKYYSDVPKEDFYSKLGVKSQPEPQEESLLDKLPRNIASGLLGLGQRGVNAPYNTAKEVQNITKPISDVFEEKLPINKYFDKNKPGYFQRVADQFNKEHNIPEHLKNPNWGINVENIPHLKERNFAQMLGQKGEGTLMDRLIQGGIEHAPEIATGKALVKYGLRKFPITKGAATRQLKEAEKLIGELHAKTPISSSNIKKSKSFLPDTFATKEMIKEAELGNYGPAFSMQSQVGHHARNLSKSPLPADRLLSFKAHEMKQNLINDIESSLRKNAHLDKRFTKAADLLKGGIKDFRTYSKFKEFIKPLVKFGGIPTTAIALLGLGYKVGKKIIND